MPPPPALPARYKFDSSVDAWDGQKITSGVPDKFCEITDTWDIHAWNTYEGYTAVPVGLYKAHVPYGGLIHRIKMNFSIDSLPYWPPGDDYMDDYSDWSGILSLAVQPVSADPSDYWGDLIELCIYGNGYLGYYDDEIISTNRITINTTYAIEMYVTHKDSLTLHTHVQVYVDGDLWVEWDMPAGDYYDGDPNIHKNCKIYVGIPESLNGPFHHGDVTMHVEDVVWTIEGPVVGWTMMAP